MKESFINQLIQKLPKDNEYYRNTLIIFPTKRACIYFKKALLDSSKEKNIWLPEIISIQEFLYEHVPTAIGLEQELLCLLFEVNKSIIPAEQNFVQFYKWGQMILKDFNEIDQYLIETPYLFHYIKSLKTIDESAELSPEQTKLLNQFWSTLPTDKNSDIREKFVKTWNSLDEIYHSFHNVLQQNGITYEGNGYRKLLESLENQEKKFQKKNFVIAGFNALSAFEERFFMHLVQHYNTEIYWDADTSYLKDLDLEAGLFIRRYQKLFPDKVNHIISTSLEQSTKKVSFVEAPLEWTQVKYAIEKIETLQLEETVLVLCDEALLYPLLNNLPESMTINITMGYPLTTHPLQTLIQHLLAFHQHKQEKKSISPTLFLKIIKHPFIKVYFPSAALHKMIRSVIRLGFVTQKTIQEVLGNELILTKLLNTEVEDHQYITSILNYLLHFEKRTILDKKATETFLQLIGSLIQLLNDNEIKLEPGELYKLLKNSLASAKLPFKSDQTDGLQIMGFLETRNLDFKNVIILGATDDHLPGTNKSGSFIPYSIRKAMSLPTFQENDAIYGYHFYRLLQRAEDISLVYAVDIDKSSINKSRFIEQIKYEWSKYEGGNISFSEQHLSIPLPKPSVIELAEINKNESNIQDAFQKYFSGEKQISASSLMTYLRCPFQFYLKYIIQLNEPEELVEEYDQRILGLIFHSAMELFYQPFLESKAWINSDILKQYNKNCNWDKLLSDAFLENEIDIQKHPLVGSNLLVRNIIQRLMEKVIQKDIELKNEFQIQGLELKIKDIPIQLNEKQTVFLKGTIDRVDCVKDQHGNTFIRIIDYKSGKAEINNYLSRKNEKPVNQYMDEYFEAVFPKQGIQGYFYAHLFDKTTPNQKITAGFYSARSLKDGLKKLRGGTLINGEVLNEFEDRLKQLLIEIFNSEIPFKQTENEKAYEYSAYKVLVE